MKKFAQIIREFFNPDKATLKVGALTLNYSNEMRNDLSKCLSLLKSKRVLFADINKEIWKHVFESLKEIRKATASLDASMQQKGPNDIKSCVNTMVLVVTSYLAEYEANYTLFIEGPLLPGLSPAHKERNWPCLGLAAADLIRLRKILKKAIENLNAFAEKGEIIEWTDSSKSAAKYWINYDSERNLCSVCGWDLGHYPRYWCPNKHTKCPHFSDKETVFRFQRLGPKEILVAGSFSEWKPIALTQYEYGEWAVRLRIDSGKYYYKFIVDGNWETDPMNEMIETDQDGNRNSVLEIK